MRDLKEIGFYTLSNDRVRSSSEDSPIQRAEFILTSRCNFTCEYCASVGGDDQPLAEVMEQLQLLIKHNLQAVRFSGGEPTLYKGLEQLVKAAKDGGVKHIAVSTNGYSSLEQYKHLVECGVNDFSISLDACCAEVGDMMAGGIKGAFNKITSNIKELSKLTYVTVGIVTTDENIDSINDIIKLADDLGVADIRVIPASQKSDRIDSIKIDQDILDSHPILAYRVANIKAGLPVRGISSYNSHRCGVVLDDVAICEGQQYPCVIYARQRGKPIGPMNENFRQDRLAWFKNTDTHKDFVCKFNCLDCLCWYNDSFEQLNIRYGKHLPVIQNSHT